MKRVCKFLTKHIVKDAALLPKPRQSNDQAVLDILEIENLNAMMKLFSIDSTASDRDTDDARLEKLSVGEQVGYLGKYVEELEEIARQLAELKGKDQKVDEGVLGKYMEVTSNKLRAI